MSPAFLLWPGRFVCCASASRRGYVGKTEKQLQEVSLMLQPFPVCLVHLLLEAEAQGAVSLGWSVSLGMEAEMLSRSQQCLLC